MSDEPKRGRGRPPKAPEDRLTERPPLRLTPRELEMVDEAVAVSGGSDRAEWMRSVVMAAARQDPFLASSPPEIIWNGFQADPYVQEPGTDFENAVRAAHRRIHGEEPGEVILPAVTDARFYGRYYGIPSLCYGSTGSENHGFRPQHPFAPAQIRRQIL